MGEAEVEVEEEVEAGQLLPLLLLPPLLLLQVEAEEVVGVVEAEEGELLLLPAQVHIQVRVRGLLRLRQHRDQ